MANSLIEGQQRARATPSERGAPASSSKPREYTTLDLVDIVFAQMPAIWPKWERMYGTEDVGGRWQYALTGVTARQVQLAIDECTRSSERDPPTPGQFRIICDKHRADAPRPAALADLTVREATWRECCGRFAVERFIANHLPVKRPPTRANAAPDFDYHGVIWSVSIPKTSALDQHRKAYERLKKVFTEEFDAYERR